ncbi:MAG: indole-3-acetate monooxygenase, partial [Thermoleophilaceae bacterium]|nr:indole-3-acetate monooxygenase [Thermoleophilaceae bacterium]
MEVARIAARLAAESERQRRLPDELVSAMVDAGIFRLLVPAAVGGLEAHPATLVDAVEELARADGAAGWCAAINATSGLLAAYLPEESAREIYGPPRTITGGVFAPRGRAVPVGAAESRGAEPAGTGGTAAGAGGSSAPAGTGTAAAAPAAGYRVTGRWPFASGCTHCDWLMGGCLVDGEVITMIAPAGEVEIHDTWHTMGLRGTGSHDIEMRDLFIPEERTAALITGTPTATGPLYAFPLFGLLALAIGAVGLGIARGALDDVTALASARKPSGSSRTMAERATVQADLATAEAQHRAARALLHESIAQAWEPAESQGRVPTEQRTSLRLASTHA